MEDLIWSRVHQRAARQDILADQLMNALRVKQFRFHHGDGW